MRNGAVAIVGMGAVCGCGPDVPSLWLALRDGRSGLRRLSRFVVPPGTGDVVGEVPDEWLGATEGVVGMALKAAAEAWESADGSPGRCAVVVGTSAGPLFTEAMTEADERDDPVGTTRLKVAAQHDAIARAVAEHVGAGGPKITVSTACSSGNAALAIARDLLLAGDADRVLVGGVDGLSPRRYAGFAALGAIADGPCAPFSEPVGLNLGEGAAFLVLERTAERALAWLLGWGGSADATHPTAPDPSGSGMARAVRAALRDAGLAAEDVDWYAAHGTGTELNDAAEWRAVESVFGRTTAVSAPKSFFGHPFGACGPLQAIAAVLAIRHGAVPPTLRFVSPRGDGPTDPVAAPRARRAAVRAVVSHNAAFGGANHTVVVAGSRPAPITRVPRTVYVHGSASIDGGPTPRLRGIDLSRMDPLSAWWTSAAASALAAVPLRGASAEGCGQVAGTAGRPRTATVAYRTSWETRGPAGVSAQAFARTVMNAPLGDAARALGLKGPMEVLVAGQASGLLALVRAAGWVRDREDVQRVVAGSFDERDPYRTDVNDLPPEGAVAVVLSPVQSDVRVAAHAIGASPAEVLARLGSAGPPDAQFTDVLAAVAALRGQRVHRACILAADLGFGAVGLVLEGA